ncbi:Kinesin-like protein KIN-14N [Holothuria leucospilota]|uniref:Kinesin-like protein KIN-14N n=1 Tax=Holothuria leucospilota TaxID=206669 RepID=A0A9Q1BZ89_HOLLE|nr:Kinesin-like protein KIN-14N [Holothuria leucospilota]
MHTEGKRQRKENENERNLLLKEKKNLHLDLELSERKYRAHRSKVKDKQKVFLRIKPQEDSSTVSASSDKIKEWSDRYNFTKIFTQDANQETIFTNTEAAELIQDTVDGGKTFIFAFGGPNSGRTYTMRGEEKNSKIHPAMGLIPRAVLQVFQLVDDLKRKEIEVKVTVSRLKSYETLQGNAVNFIELSHLNPEKNAFYNVLGLKVEMKVYVVTKPEEGNHIKHCFGHASRRNRNFERCYKVIFTVLEGFICQVLLTAVSRTGPYETNPTSDPSQSFVVTADVDRLRGEVGR